MDRSLLCSSIHGIFQARVLEWVAISFSRGSSWPRDRTQVSRTVGRRFHHLPELAQTHVSWVSDAIQPSHPLSFTSPTAFNLFLISRSFQMSQFFISGSQSIGASVSASVLPINIQDWSHLGWTGWMSLQFKGLSRVSSNSTVQKHQFFSAQPSLWSNCHIHTWLLEKTITLTRQTFVGKIMSLLFNMQSRLVLTFLPRSKCLLISWLQSPSAVILEL